LFYPTAFLTGRILTMGFVVVGYVNADGNEVKIKEFLLNIFPLY